MDTPLRGDEWKEKLTPEQYRVLREQGTEAPFSGAYVHTKEKGKFRCATCDSHLGHVFDDGPSATTGKRYCINSVCLDLEKDTNA